LKKHKPWFKKGCSKLLKETRQNAGLQDPSETNGVNLNNIRRETSKHFRNNKREYLKDKINDHAKNSKNRTIRDLYRGTNVVKRGHQPRSYLMKDQNGDLLADPDNILNRWKNASLSY
jgi:hypothetical protein